MSYHWTDTDAEIEALAGLADAIEVAGCRDLGDEIERCDGEAADLFSVYFHFSPEWGADPRGLRGAMCVADRDTVEAARIFAAELSQRFTLKIYDYA